MPYEPFIGELSVLASQRIPTGWAPCDGRELLISHYSALFSLLGNRYGGNGVTTFRLPDLRGRVPLGAGIASDLSSYRCGEKGAADYPFSTASPDSETTADAHRTPVHAARSFVPPFLALNWIIALQGIYPSGEESLVEPNHNATDVSPDKSNASNQDVVSDSSTDLGDRLTPGMAMQPGQRLFSKNRAAFLTYQPDGNAVVYLLAGSVQGDPIWASNTDKSRVGSLTLLAEGGLTLKGASGQLLFQSGGSDCATLIMQDDCNLVIYDSANQPVWASKGGRCATNSRPSPRRNEELLSPGPARSHSDSEEDQTVYQVVVNAEEQYSLWPDRRAIPPGWNTTGHSGTKRECLEYIQTVWTDMRPLSFR